MLNNTIKLKTETRTLEQIKEILAESPQNSELINKAIIEAIEKLYTKLIVGEGPTLLLTDETQFDVIPLAEYKQFMYDLTGKKGPYRVLKTHKSWVGLSDGVYCIENCDKLIPVSWCKKGGSSKLNLFLLISSITQSGLILTLLLL